MSGEVIKSFLVGLGFGVDDASLAKFNKAIATATVRVTALYASTKIAAAGIVYGISKISEGFEQMGYEYRLIVPAINKALMLRKELLKAYAAAGINITKVVQQSVKLNFSLAKTRFAFEAIYRSVASRFFDLLTKQSDLFRQKIYANMPKIQAILERMVKFIFKALEATTALGVRLWSILTRVYDFFVLLDKSTDGWSTKILAVIAAWQLLNLSFLATPLGMLITGLVALLALYDDFKTFQEGGASLFNWTSFIPVIDAVTAAIRVMYQQLQNLADIAANTVLIFLQLFQGDFSGAWDSLGTAIRAVGSYLMGVVNTVVSLAKALGSVAYWGAQVAGFVSGPNVGANLGGTGGGVPQASPVSSGVQNSQTNQHVQQQTSINVTGSADASAVGKAVAGEQSKVNFDMVRNMRGATR